MHAHIVSAYMCTLQYISLTHYTILYHILYSAAVVPEPVTDAEPGDVVVTLTSIIEAVVTAVATSESPVLPDLRYV